MRPAYAKGHRALHRSLASAALLLIGSWWAQAGPAARETGESVAAAPRPDLSGVWVLNQKRSEDPWEKLELARDRAWFSNGRRGGWGGRQSSTEGVGMGRGPGSRNEGLEQLRPLWNAPRKLSLSHQDPLLEMRVDDRRTRRIYTDNRGVSVSASGASQGEVSTAGWERGVLVVETTTDAGTQVVERYRLAEGGQRLLVTRELLTLQTSEPVTVETAYDRQPRGSGAE